MDRPALRDSRIGWSVERYLALAADGSLGPDDRVELLDGVIVSMSPQSARHAVTVTRARDALLAAVAGRALVREEKPLALATTSLPEPDLAVVAREAGLDESAHPTTALLVVEVADTSLPQDRLTKARLYAAAAIAEYWIVNLRDDQVEVFRAPANGVYAERTVARRGDAVALLGLAETVVQVADLLPRPPA